MRRATYPDQHDLSASDHRGAPGQSLLRPEGGGAFDLWIDVLTDIVVGEVLHELLDSVGPVDRSCGSEQGGGAE